MAALFFSPSKDARFQIKAARRPEKFKPALQLLKASILT